MADIFEYDVFLSFASSDEEIVKPIWQELCLSGLRVFWSDASLKKEAGNSWFEVIQSSLEKSRHLVLFCSPASMVSQWVQREYSAFLSHCYRPNVRRLVPVLLQGYKASDLPLFIKNLEAWHLGCGTSMKDLISLLGGVNIEELRSENEFLKQNLESLSHEKSSMEAEIKRLNEQLAEQKPSTDNRKADVDQGLKSPADERGPEKHQEAFEFLGLPFEATSKQISDRYFDLRDEYLGFLENCPKELNEICQSRLSRLEDAFGLVYEVRTKEEDQKIEQAFEMLQLRKDADPAAIKRRFAQLKRTCVKALQSSDSFIKEAAARELSKLDEVSSVLLSTLPQSPAVQSDQIEVVMPQMGESITEATVTKWLKKEGERVERDEPLFEISTDKVDAEIPSIAAGTVTQILVAEGETVDVNTVVALLTREDS